MIRVELDERRIVEFGGDDVGITVVGKITASEHRPSWWRHPLQRVRFARRWGWKANLVITAVDVDHLEVG